MSKEFDGAYADDDIEYTCRLCGETVSSEAFSQPFNCCCKCNQKNQDKADYYEGDIFGSVTNEEQ